MLFSPVLKSCTYWNRIQQLNTTGLNTYVERLQFICIQSWHSVSVEQRIAIVIIWIVFYIMQAANSESCAYSWVTFDGSTSSPQKQIAFLVSTKHFQNYQDIGVSLLKMHWGLLFCFVCELQDGFCQSCRVSISLDVEGCSDCQ